MACRILRINSEKQWLESTRWLEKRSMPSPQVKQAVKEIIESVKNEGNNAVLAYARKFDCPDLQEPFNVPVDDILTAPEKISSENRRYIKQAIENIRKFHEAQIEKSWFMNGQDGILLGQMVTPVDSAGLYVPGGKGGATPLVSSLLMNAIPAQTAGCERIAVVSPSRPDGTLDENLLAAAALLNIKEVYRIGGAWSIAALAYGTTSIPPVSVIAGPGNIYVTTAKKLLHGKVGIDMIAGPSEIMIIYDGYANPEVIAMDMLSQAEHDPLASAICLAPSEKLAEAIHSELEKQLLVLPRRDIAAKSLADWGCIAIVPDLELCIKIANLVAPEHLEVNTVNPWEMLPLIKNAGAVFLGENSPEAMGDYYAGPNHVLPTLGTARFSSALSVDTFCKKTSIIASTKDYLINNVTGISALARLEGLEAHALSVEKRTELIKNVGKFFKKSKES